MRRGFIIGILSASLAVGGGCAAWPRYEYASWNCDELYVTDEEPEPLYPGMPLGRPLAAADRKRKKKKSSVPRWVKGVGISMAVIIGLGAGVMTATLQN